MSATAAVTPGPWQQRHRRWSMMRALLLGTVSLLVPAQARADNLIELLKTPGHVAFMRHALAPFEGAPKSHGVSAETLGPCDVSDTSPLGYLRPARIAWV